MPDLKTLDGQTEYATAAHGAPPLPSTLWLLDKLACLPDGAEPRTLYRQWLERYRQHRGFDPVDSRRSFRAALDTCRRHLEGG